MEFLAYKQEQLCPIIVIYRIVLSFPRIKMYNYKIKTSFLSPEMKKELANKTGFFIIMIVHFYIHRI